MSGHFLSVNPNVVSSGDKIATTVLEGLKQYAEEYEQDIYRQLLYLTDKKKAKPQYFTEKGNMVKTLFKTDKDGQYINNWKKDLKTLLKQSNSYVTDRSTQSDADIQKGLADLSEDILNWIATSPDGKTGITNLGVEFLSDELKNGKWINLKNGSRVVSKNSISPGGMQGLKREAKTLLGLHDWAKTLDPNSVTMDTVDFNGRHQEGRFDIFIKFSKEATYGSRRPLRLENKKSLNDFVIGTLPDTLWDAMEDVEIKRDSKGVLRAVVNFSSMKLRDVADAFLSDKYTKGGTLNNANTLPIFTSGTDFLLFSEFIELAETKQRNFFIGFNDEVHQALTDPKNWEIILKHYYNIEQLEEKLYKLDKRVITKKLHGVLTYGRPNIY